MKHRFETLSPQALTENPEGVQDISPGSSPSPRVRPPLVKYPKITPSPAGAGEGWGEGAGDVIPINASTITAFFLSHRGRCFDGWHASKISQYVHWHLNNGTLFTASNADGTIGLVVIAWPDNALKIQALAAYQMPQFVWQDLPSHGDSILIADVAGDRRLMADILKQVTAHWVDSPDKRLFTYRRGKLVELSWKTIFRFAKSEGPILSSRGATLEISQTRSVWWTARKYICPEGTTEFPPSFQDGMSMGEYPDTPCLANFRLCLRHEQERPTGHTAPSRSRLCCVNRKSKI